MLTAQKLHRIPRSLTASESRFVKHIRRIFPHIDNMTWNHSKRNYKADIETLGERFKEKRQPYEIRPLIDEIGAEDLAEILMMIYNQVIHQDRDKEWIQQALDRQEKLESRNWNAGRPSKVEKYANSISNAYKNPKMEDDYWKTIWKEAKKNCGRSTLWRIRKKLEEEHGMKIDEPHGNAEWYDGEITMIELETFCAETDPAQE